MLPFRSIHEIAKNILLKNFLLLHIDVVDLGETREESNIFANIQKIEIVPRYAFSDQAKLVDNKGK
jgi:hypothetical protein